MTWLERNWYKKGLTVNFLLLPFSILVFIVTTIKFWLYRWNLLKARANKVPVIVVGNINVGGTGKTPFVEWLVAYLREKGFHPAIVSRGYGAKQDDKYPYPRLLQSVWPASLCGDEPKLLLERCRCPVVIDPNRARAVELASRQPNVNIVISDDGLQHYKMARDIELVIIDARKGVGNGYLLPVGPLREMSSRLKYVDLVIRNSGMNQTEDAEYYLQASRCYHLLNGSELDQKEKSEQKVHLVTGIGNPERFKDTVLDSGFSIASETYFPDHHEFKAQDFKKFDNTQIILMTEKDAIKCKELDLPLNIYVLPIKAKLSNSTVLKIDSMLGKLNRTK